MGTKGNPATVNQLNAPELMGDGILYLILIIRSTCHRVKEDCPNLKKVGGLVTPTLVLALNPRTDY